MRSSNSITILRLCLLMTMLSGSLVALAAPDAQAIDSQTTDTQGTWVPELLTGADIVVLPQTSLSAKPETATRELLQGNLVDGACQYSVSFHSEQGDTAPQVASFVAIDPTSCMAEIERGEPAMLPAVNGTMRAAQAHSKTKHAKSKHAKSKHAKSKDVSIQGQNKDRKASFWTIWEDPAKAVVAEVRTSVRSHVQNQEIQEANCTLHIDPLEQTGWQVDADYQDFACNWNERRATSVADVHFFNDDFLGPACSGRDRTHIYVVRNLAKVTLKGYDGTVGDTWKSGGCSGLLGHSQLYEPTVYYR